MVKRFVPDAGDIVWLEFDPQAGTEQAGHRPALVLSPFAYNNKSGLFVVCPLTTQIKRNPFEVEGISLNGKDSVVLSDHIKSLDWRVRNAKFIAKAPQEVMEEVLSKVSALIGLNQAF